MKEISSISLRVEDLISLIYHQSHHVALGAPVAEDGTAASAKRVG